MNDTITNFYTKNPEENYIDTYDSQHGARLDAMVERFNLKNIKDLRIVDVGGGLGFLGKRLDESNFYCIVDGASVPKEKLLCKVDRRIVLDLDHAGMLGALFKYSKYTEETREDVYDDKKYDYGFILETIEHISNPFFCLNEMKKVVKKDGEIIISFPHENVWHNVVYPGLFWPKQNFEIFLEQMALPIIDYWLWDKGWNAYHYRCRNAGWDEKKMIFPKQEEKFRFANPLEMTNL